MSTFFHVTGWTAIMLFLSVFSVYTFVLANDYVKYSWAWALLSMAGASCALGWACQGFAWL